MNGGWARGYTHNREVHSVGSMKAEVGSPLKTFGEGRKGKCGHILSRYNPKDDLCRPCARKARDEALAAQADEPAPDGTRPVAKEVLAELPGTAASIGRHLGITTKRAGDVLRRQWMAGKIERSGEPGQGQGPTRPGVSTGGYYYFYPEEP